MERQYKFSINGDSFLTRNPILALFLCTVSGAVFAAQPNQWHGLVLDQSSPDQAIKVLGQPAISDSGGLQDVIRNVGKHYRTPAVATAYRISKLDTAKDLPVKLLLFESVEGFNKVVLIFRDEKLALIALAPDKTNKIKAADIAEEYGVPFRPIFNQQDFDAM
jgi:hypothetical protein